MDDGSQSYSWTPLHSLAWFREIYGSSTSHWFNKKADPLLKSGVRLIGTELSKAEKKFFMWLKYYIDNHYTWAKASQPLDVERYEKPIFECQKFCWSFA